MQPTENNDQSEFNFELAEFSTFGFYITDIKNQNLIGRAWCLQKTKT